MKRFVLIAGLLASACGILRDGPPDRPAGVPCLDTRQCNCYVIYRGKWEFEPCPLPTPTPSPTPAPTPTPVPTPTPTPTPVVGCGLPRGTGSGIGCPRENAIFGDAVATAQEATFALREGVEGDRITDSVQYHAALVRHLEEKGYCAFFDGEEIAVKRSNDFSEQWDMESASGKPIRMYAATCKPAWEAIPGAPGPQPSPTPTPTPSPCVPETVTVPFQCPAGTPDGLQCWKCSERIAWDEAKGDWIKVPGQEGRLWYNYRGGDPTKPEYLNNKCEYVTRDGHVLRTREQQFGRACVDSNAVCPDSMTITKPCPSPSVPPPPAGQCPDVRSVGTYLHSVICNGVVSNNPDGTPKPQAGCRHSFGATAYFADANGNGGFGNHYRCSECSYEWSKNQCCGGLGQDAPGKVNQCDDPRGPEFFLNGGSQGRTWRFNVTLGSGTYRIDACASNWTDRLGRTHPGGGCSVSPLTVVVP